MAVFRIEKTRDYTVMSNHHLRDQSLSLNAKGLLSMMLSLPEEWNYATRGLASICKEGTDSIGSALKELERTGYIVRNRLRDSKGKILERRAGKYRDQRQKYQILYPCGEKVPCGFCPEEGHHCGTAPLSGIFQKPGRGCHHCSFSGIYSRKAAPETVHS